MWQLSIERIRKETERRNMYIEWIIALVGVSLLSIVDIKEREIPAALLWIFGILAVLYHLISRGGSKELGWIFPALTPGFLLLLISFCTGESIGYGDGWTVVIIGILIGAKGGFLAVCIGVYVSSLYSLILLAAHKVSRKSRFAFLPFLTIGLGVGFLAQKGL